jgi:hypothetical protein
MNLRISLLCGILLTVTASVQAQEWSRYVPEKQRKEIFKKSIKSTGVGLAMTGQAAGVIWVTEPMARVLVSQAIDRERLTNEEAEARFRQLRPEDSYLFLINALRVGVSPLGGLAASNLGNPLSANETFLQRGDDRKKFSRAEIADHQFDIHLGGLVRGPDLQSAYVVVFPRKDRSGEQIVRDLVDKIEIQFTLSGKKVVLDYKIKELVTNLESL